MSLARENRNVEYIPKQVNILISKNQALQILYFNHLTTYVKLHKLIMDKKFNKICKNLIPTKTTTIPYNTKGYNTIKPKRTL